MQGDENDQWYFGDALYQHYLFAARAKEVAEWDSDEIYKARQAYFCQLIRNPEHLPEELMQQYEFASMLGSGAFGAVLASRVRNSNPWVPEVAIKLIQRADVHPSECTRHPEVGLMPNEVFLMTKLDHQNILKVHDFYSDESSFIVVTEAFGCEWTASNPLLKFDENLREEGWPYIQNTAFLGGRARGMSDAAIQASQRGGHTLHHCIRAQ